MTPSDIFGQLTAVFIDWQGFLKNPQYVRDGNTITWAGARPIFLSETLTKSDTAQLARNGQYSFRVSDDDSIIQISYRFSQNGGIEAARLAYYEVGAPLSDEELDVRPWEGQDDIGEPAKWIRFDYTHTGLGRVLHMDSHLHISGLPGIRFPVTGIPTPKQFVELVFSHFYPNAYQKMRLDEACTFESFAAVDSINADSLAPQHDLAEVYQRIPHFRVPRRTTHSPH